ncbi:hypothetical protein [Nitratifractor sp.]
MEKNSRCRSARRLLERLNEEAFNRLTHYRYNHSEKMSERYRRGRISALKWFCELSAFYLEREAALPGELREKIRRERGRIEWMPPGPYRRGIEDTVREMERILEEES